jgi:hypothetical protein
MLDRVLMRCCHNLSVSAGRLIQYARLTGVFFVIQTTTKKVGVFQELTEIYLTIHRLQMLAIQLQPHALYSLDFHQ